MTREDSRDVESGALQQALTTREALLRLHDDMDTEMKSIKTEFNKKPFFYWLKESISFKSELSKMRWPSVIFMTTHAMAHFIVAFVLDVDNLAVAWVGFQGFVLFGLLLISLAVNLWDTRLRFGELLMRSEQILTLIRHCSQDKHLLKQWRQYNWNAAQAKSLFIPKSPCVHHTLTYRDDSCLNLPDFLLVKGDIIHLYPGERAPGDCISLKTVDEANDATLGETDKISLLEGQIFHTTQLHGLLDQSHQPDKHGSSEEFDKLEQLKKGIVHARLKKSNRGTDFLMLSTPYIKSLRMSLQRSHKRPVNSVEKECFIVSRKYFETFVIPSVFLMSTLVTAIHYGYLDLTDSDQKIKTISIAHLLMRPSLTIMPFLPWMFPCFWLAVNAYGSARLLCCADAQIKKARCKSSNRQAHEGISPKGDFNSGVPSKFDNLLATPTAGGSSENKHDEDDLNDLKSNVEFLAILKVCINLINGKGGHVWRSSSLLQVLGSLTSLCCIDKVGVLSWSNPTPEKVFVLARNEDQAKFMIPMSNNSDDNISRIPQADSSNQQTLMSSDGELINQRLGSFMTGFTDGIEKGSPNRAGSHVRHPGDLANKFRAEILDLSQTSNIYRDFGMHQMPTSQHFRLQFDDLSWRKFIDRLKPLGLAIMLNNCCEDSFGDYFRFYKHICYESILRCNLTPVVKRRCVCALAELIGFSKDAVSSYKYVSQIGIYKLIDPSNIKKEKLVPSIENTTRLKLPFPNMVCNLHRDIHTGRHQAFSYGTADAILDACVEFWDGKQLVPLDQSTRKKIADFYHRTSLTSYCSAFAYTPLLDVHNLGDKYIELPPDNAIFTSPFRKLNIRHQEEFLQRQSINIPPQTTTATDSKVDSGAAQILHESHLSVPENQVLDANSMMSTAENFSLANSEQRGHRITRRHLSVEDIVDSAGEKRHDEANSGDSKKNRKLTAVLDELTDQVFVGMVSMQYQACPDFVGLVEQLEHACIRFVHFSKENELRSRVFSEKMGLESGWNCHISLQSDQDLDEALKSDAGYRVPENRQRPSKSEIFSLSARISSLFIGNDAAKRWSAKNNGSCSTRDSISSDERTLYSWKSLPSLVMQLTSKLHSNKRHSPKRSNQLDTSSTNMDASSERAGDQSKWEEHNEVDSIEEPESVKNEGFDSLAFDMSNRAKLPKGIENIRPHLETVDNVPLQVSLFTDCTPELTKEMIEIMQDYGEIVCVIGSSSSKLNTAVFLQANASIAIEPLMPQCCTCECRNISKDIADKKKSRRRKTRHDRHMKQKSSKEDAQTKKGNKTTDSEENGRNDYTVIEMKPRLNNPRDRLGIRPNETTTATPIRIKSANISPSSSSSSSSSSESASSLSKSSSRFSPAVSRSASESEIGEGQSFFDEMMSDDDLLDKTGELECEFSKCNLAKELPTPYSLASRLASLPCSYSYNRKDPVNLYGLILEARHFTFKMKNTFVCMICFALSISSAQFLASILFLPPMLSSGLTIWLTIAVVPSMSFSLMSTRMDSQVMKLAVGKNLQLKPENITFFVLCYLVKFIPSIIVVVFCFGLIIAHSCKLTGFGSSSLGPCWMFTYVQHGNATSGTDTGQEDLLWSTHLLTAQVCVAFLLVLYFVVISSGFVHRSHLMWQRSPFKNRMWVFTSLVLIFGQLLYNYVVLQINLDSSGIPYEFLASLPAHIWIISFIWPVLVIGINLLVKRAEIKATTRQQRRARFDFNTKLGMNSPF